MAGVDPVGHAFLLPPLHVPKIVEEFVYRAEVPRDPGSRGVPGREGTLGHLVGAARLALLRHRRDLRRFGIEREGGVLSLSLPWQAKDYLPNRAVEAPARPVLPQRHAGLTQRG